MKFLTIIYPIFVNRTADGLYEYGFITGEQKKMNGFFEKSGVVVRTFSREQAFKFLVPVKVEVITSDDADELGSSSESISFFKRLLFPKSDKVIKIVGSDLDTINFTEVEEQKNEK